MSFPKGFLIGAATAAHQVEGNNIHSDYWAQENLPHTSFTEPSGLACDHYNRYEEDIKLLSDAGLNAYRFSIEWARIEPEEGQFDEAEIEHYRKVIACCHANGVEPIVTLMHFTSPVWLIRKGGWEAESTVEYFRRYAAHVTEKLGGELNYICTINEANMGLQLAAISKRFMLMAEQAKKATASGAKKAEGTVQVGMNFEKMMENMKFAAMENAQIFGTPQPQIFVSSRTPEGDALVFRAHQAAKAAIKARYPNIRVGITLSMHDLQALPGGEKFAEDAWDEEFRHYLPYIQDDDFLGVQNYTRTQYGPQGQLPCPEGAELTQMDYEFYPEALEHVIRRVHEDFKGNLIVTENGVAVSDDSRRVEFIRRALQGVENCLNDG
ncbi:MAG: glycoside hydrolase family 1 protein, partial [Clostridia bacterium]|nr:glycoside hydrolase family 1 protein [Clostridia bacterium]